MCAAINIFNFPHAAGHVARRGRRARGREWSRERASESNAQRKLPITSPRQVAAPGD